MINAVITRGNEQKENLLILSNEEAQKIINSMEYYCKNHKREKKAKKLLKELIEDCHCW